MSDICETICDRRERVLVFTQFKEMTEPISDLLSSVFKREGLVLHGSTPVKRRNVIYSNVYQEIAYGLMNMRITGKELDDTLEWAMEVVGIKGMEKKSLHNLSDGEKKRVALASVLAMKPKVLVLDEPTAALDPRGVGKLVELLKTINRELGVTLVFATHDVDIVPLLADKVYLLSKGEMVLSGNTQEVFSEKEILRKIDLRLPRVAHLAELLERDGKLTLEELPLTIGQAKRILSHL